MIETPQRALVIFAHPDDAEFGCSGTVAKWTREGAKVFYTVCTNGDKGSNDPNMTSERLVKLRHQEQLDASKVLGVEEVVFLNNPDGGLEDTTDLRRDMVRSIRRFKPDIVICPNAFYQTRFSHRDHRVAGIVALDAMFPYARDRLHYPELLKEGLEPHKTAMALMWGSEEPDEFIDISSTIETKIKALLCHKSQAVDGAWAKIGDRMKDGAREAGKKAELECAEAFRKIPFRR
ncbi:MAG: PIG-L deacetylase family protein [Chloroflexota bacterium]|nr:PIG-L deacetylase family protein [Chloroflexota bacterium]